MNTRETNEKIVKHLQNINMIPADEQKESKIEEVTEEMPFAFARKCCGALSIAMWIFAIVSLIFGFTEIRLTLFMILLPMGLLAGFNVPVFLKKRKIFDMVVAIIAGAVCIIVAFALLFFGGRQ